MVLAVLEWWIEDSREFGGPVGSGGPVESQRGTSVALQQPCERTIIKEATVTHDSSTKHRLAAVALAALTLGSTTGCGTLLFPERQHEDHSGDLDPNVLVLDGIGLLFFVVPGLVAFVVDFSTGAIYLPVGVERGEGPFFGDDGVVDELTD